MFIRLCICTIRAAVCGVFVTPIGRACTFSSYHHAPSRSQAERAVLCPTSRLSDASAWPGAASAVGRHINKLSVTVKTSHAIKITLSTPRLDITLESSSPARLQEVWPTNILMRADLIMVKEGLATVQCKVIQNCHHGLKPEMCYRGFTNYYIVW